MQAKQSLCTKKASFPSAAVAISVDNIMRCNFGAATIPVSSNAFFSWTRPKSLAATRESSLWSGTSIRIEMLHLHGENSTSQTTPYFLRSKLSSNRTWLASHRSEGIRIGIQDVIAPVGSSSALARASVLSDTTTPVGKTHKLVAIAIPAQKGVARSVTEATIRSRISRRIARPPSGIRPILLCECERDRRALICRQSRCDVGQEGCGEQHDLAMNTNVERKC